MFEKLSATQIQSADGHLNAEVDKTLSLAAEYLLSQQDADGHWHFELEADATMPAQFMFLLHFVDQRRLDLEPLFVNYMKRIQGDHGGWPLYHGGEFNISATVQAYFACKLCGVDKDEPFMVRAREAVLAFGGAGKANVFSLIHLALFGQIPWHAVPVMPVEIMLLPRWFPIHLDKMAYWSRTFIWPLVVILAKKQIAVNPTGATCVELFPVHPNEVTWWYHDRPGFWPAFFRTVDRVLQVVEPYFPSFTRNIAIDRAVKMTTERLNGDDGLGAILPSMANAVMMLHVIGVPKDDPKFVTAMKAMHNLVVIRPNEAYPQSCLSPIWDTALSTHAVLEYGGKGLKAGTAASDWLVPHQILDVKGDWAVNAPNLRPGGWAFQYANAYYPDVDDTAVAVMGMHRIDPDRYKNSIDRAVEWIIGMQSSNGGWGAFDIDNHHHYLNHIPFADHGALLDPPTADVSARCLSMLAQLGYSQSNPTVKRALAYLLKEQETDGSWFGRWGTNYVYGTWSVLCALNAVGLPHDHPAIRKAVTWMLSKQRADGGWGESGDSYWDTKPRGAHFESTASQTAWACMGLMAAGEVHNDAVRRGMEYLGATILPDGQWDEPSFTSVGFPRVFYLRYHGYRKFFPVMALARYRNLINSGEKRIEFGM